MEWAAGLVRGPFSLPGSGEVRILRARTPPTSLGAGSSLRWKERGASGWPPRTTMKTRPF